MIIRFVILAVLTLAFCTLSAHVAVAQSNSAEDEAWTGCEGSYSYTTEKPGLLFCQRDPSAGEKAFLLSAGNLFLKECEVSDVIAQNPVWSSFKASMTLSMTSSILGSGYETNMTNGLAGRAYAEGLGCDDANPFMTEANLYLARLYSDPPVDNAFMRGCMENFDGEASRTKCTCIRNVAIQSYPSLKNPKAEYYRELPKQLIENNPIIGLQLVGQCGLTEY